MGTDLTIDKVTETCFSLIGKNLVRVTLSEDHGINSTYVFILDYSEQGTIKGPAWGVSHSPDMENKIFIINNEDKPTTEKFVLQFLNQYPKSEYPQRYILDY